MPTPKPDPDREIAYVKVVVEKRERGRVLVYPVMPNGERNPADIYPRGRLGVHEDCVVREAKG